MEQWVYNGEWFLSQTFGEQKMSGRHEVKPGRDV